MRRTELACLAVLALAACGDTTEDTTPRECNSWRQWGNSASHAGASCVRGQPLRTILSDIVYDPFLDQEVADAEGVLVIHYQTPLIDGDDLYMMTKGGTYTPCNRDMDGQPVCFEEGERYRLNSQSWVEQHFTIAADGKLTFEWKFESDWKPPPIFGFEPMFQPALAGDLIAIPAAGGGLWQLDRHSGAVVRHVQPFGDSPDTYVAGGLTAVPDGTIYYSAIAFTHDQPDAGPVQAWLVAVSRDGLSSLVDYKTLVPGAPTDCSGIYNVQTTPLPWPPRNLDGTLVAPPVGPCGAQRPGINTTPAVGADGTIFVVSRAHNNARYSYAIAINPDLSPKWATSMRDYLHDGCGITTASNGTETENRFACAVGTPVGVERVTGLAPAGTVTDSSSSSPVALPDGGVLYGAFTGYNGSRGHLFKLDHNGAITGNYDFGWDSTPAVIGSATSYKIIIKDNHYGTDQAGVDLGPFYITELDSSLRPIWQFQSTNKQSCERAADGARTCTEDHPNGFEWCINAVAVDIDGTVYANSEDGNAYAITADGKFRDAVFLEKSIGAAYTPTALDRAGHVFTLNNGHLTVLGR